MEVMHAGLGQFAAHHDRLLIAHGKMSDKLIDAEEERDRLRSGVTELEAADDKTGDMAMDSVSKGDMVELQAKVAKILEEVQSYTTAVKNTSAEAVLMRAEILKVKANVSSTGKCTMRELAAMLTPSRDPQHTRPCSSS